MKISVIFLILLSKINSFLLHFFKVKLEIISVKTESHLSGKSEIIF